MLLVVIDRNVPKAAVILNTTGPPRSSGCGLGQTTFAAPAPWDRRLLCQPCDGRQRQIPSCAQYCAPGSEFVAPDCFLFSATRPPGGATRTRCAARTRARAQARHDRGADRRRSVDRSASPLDFIACLAALVPPPRAHLTRYHGVFAANAALRAAITPAARGAGAQKRLAVAKQPTPKDIRLNWARRLTRPVQCPSRSATRVRRRVSTTLALFPWRDRRAQRCVRREHAAKHGGLDVTRWQAGIDIRHLGTTRRFLAFSSTPSHEPRNSTGLGRGRAAQLVSWLRWPRRRAWWRAGFR